MDYFLLMFLLVVLFYLLIPGIGAFLARERWRRFRSEIVESSFTPIAGFGDIGSSSNSNAEVLLGKFRFFGTLEAIQGKNTIWLRDGKITLAVEMKKAQVYLLPSTTHIDMESTIEQNEEVLPDEAPKSISWNRVFSLPEGTRMFVCGSLFSRKGKIFFDTSQTSPLTVVIYDGEEDTILRRSIWGGRQRNEYWNQFTPGSLAAGSISLLFLSYFLLRQPLLRVEAIFALTSAMIPAIPFFPPGVIFFFIYRNLWRRGRFLRAERDLIRLPLRYFNGKDINDTALLPDGSAYVLKRIKDRFRNGNIEYSAKVRSSTLLQPAQLLMDEYVAFGTPHATEVSDVIKKPDDPMAELIMIPGDPATLASLCDKKAKRLEYLSVATFIAGFFINAYVVLFVLSRLIR